MLKDLVDCNVWLYIKKARDISFLFCSKKASPLCHTEEPTDEEIKDLPVLDISSPEGKWEPKNCQKRYLIKILPWIALMQIGIK